jgi:hypothetical protein
MNAAVGLMQMYCGVAVGKNQRNMKDMKKAVWATILTKHQLTEIHINSCAIQVMIHGVDTRQQRQV